MAHFKNKIYNPDWPGRADPLVNRRGGVPVGALRTSQSSGQLHRLLPERAQLGPHSTLRRDRPARQQAPASVVSRSGLAAVEMAARLARQAKVFTQTAPRCEKENCHGPGPATGHRSVALAHRSGQHSRAGLELAKSCRAAQASFSLYKSNLPGKVCPKVERSSTLQLI